MRAPIVLGTYLLAAGCGGQTLNVGDNAGADNAGAAPQYSGPVSPGVNGGTGIAGPTPVATHQYGALAVAVDESRVYWSSDAAGQTLNDYAGVRSCTKADCAASLVTYASQQCYANRIAVHQGRIYWRAASCDQSSRSIVACSVDGCLGAPAVITSGPGIADLLVDDQTVYFTSDMDSAVLSCPIDGCRGAPTVVVLVEDPAARIAADQKNLYWSEAVTADSGVIKTVPKDGSAPVRTIASGLHLPGAVAVDANRVYWAESFSPGTIRSCPIAGCAGEPTTLAAGQRYPHGLAVDRAHAYWYSAAAPYETAPYEPYGGPPGEIFQCPLTGCGSSPTVLAADQPTPTGLAVDLSFVFWTNYGEAKYDPGLYNDGSVNRVPIAP